MNLPHLTLDIDWAPDVAIDFVADQLIKHKVRATWFVTHSSPSVERLQQYPELFEMGIHPNFMPGSTHGENPSEILAHCLDLVPNARCMRIHSLFQSSPLLLQILKESSINIDSSIFLPYAADLRPVPFRWQGKELVRLPYCFGKMTMKWLNLSLTGIGRDWEKWDTD